MNIQPAYEIADEVRAGRLSARAVLEEALARIEATNPTLNAFVHIDAEGARRQADAIDQAVARGEDPGLLAGVPLGVKDLEPVVGLPHTDGSRVFADRIASRDSHQVARLRAAGAVIVGKTNTPEFGYKGFTTNLLFGATRNPWNPEKTPGGSSGGSAAAVSAGMVPLCTASDGGGSIRIPSAFSGCYGIKPSSGRIPRGDEHAPTWGTHSTRGPVSRNVRDAARYMDVAAGPHPDDLDSLDAPSGIYEQAVLAGPPRITRIGWSADLGYAVVDAEVRKLAEEGARVMAAALGAELVEADPGFPDPMAAWYTIAAPGDTRLIDDMTADERGLLEPGFVAFAEQARGITGVAIARALDERHQVNRAMSAYFDKYDLLLTPSVACTAFAAGGPPPREIGGKALGFSGVIPFTPPFNLTGHPAANLPVGLASDGLPVGLQIVGPRHADALVLAVSAAFEAARPWRFPK